MSKLTGSVAPIDQRAYGHLMITRTSKVNYDPVTTPPCLRRLAASAAQSAGRLGSYSDPVQSGPQVYYGEYDEGKLLGFIAGAALLVSIGAARAKDPVKLTDGPAR
jgi:hypothetical protein